MPFLAENEQKIFKNFVDFVDFVDKGCNLLIFNNL